MQLVVIGVAIRCVLCAVCYVVVDKMVEEVKRYEKGKWRKLYWKLAKHQDCAFPHIKDA